jgi:hypothetical protein
MNAWMILFAIAGQAPAPPSPPAQPVPAAGTARDVSAQLTMIIETGENQLNVQETWNLKNRGGGTIPAAALEIPLPRGAKFARVEEKVRAFRVAESMMSIEATEPMPPGDRDLMEGYIYDANDGSADMQRPIPFAVENARFIIQDFPGLSVSTSARSEKRTRDLNGRTFAIYDMTQLPMGVPLSISITGLPSHTLWPRRLALAGVFAILAWMVFALSTKSVPGKEGEEPIIGPLSPHAKRDQIVKAIEVLERDFKEEKVKEKRFQRRHAELLKELGTVLKEIELEKSA